MTTDSTSSKNKTGIRWKPTQGHIYWFLDGLHMAQQAVYTDSKQDRRAIQIGNAYRTKNLATAAATKIQAFTKTLSNF